MWCLIKSNQLGIVFNPELIDLSSEFNWYLSVGRLKVKQRFRHYVICTMSLRIKTVSVVVEDYVAIFCILLTPQKAGVVRLIRITFSPWQRDLDSFEIWGQLISFKQKRKGLFLIKTVEVGWFATALISFIALRFNPLKDMGLAELHWEELVKLVFRTGPNLEWVFRDWSLTLWLVFSVCFPFDLGGVVLEHTGIIIL